MSDAGVSQRTGREGGRTGGRLLRLGIVTAVLPVATLIAQTPVPTSPAESQAESLAPRVVSGRVVRPGASGMLTVPGAWVTLHRVAPDSSGPVDSVRADAGGRYSIRYRPAGGDAVYFASSMFGGVAYFTPPLPATDAGGDAGEITVFDTTSRRCLSERAGGISSYRRARRTDVARSSRCSSSRTTRR